MAIFGKIQSTNRDALLQAAKGEILKETGERLTEDQQRVAALVLEFRDQYRQSAQHDESKEDTEPILIDHNGRPINHNGKILEKVSLDSGRVEDGVDVELGTEKVESLDSRPKYVTNNSSEFDKLVDSLLNNEKCQIPEPEYWREALKKITRPSARALVVQLESTICPMGYNPLAVPHDPLRGTAASSSCDGSLAATSAGKKGSFLHFCREMKAKHPECVLLTRCGDFFEAFGVDAIMLVEHCGLNAMAGKAKAGFPFRAIQASLDCLVQKGFKVAVYEEATDTDASAGAGAKAGSKSRLKSRMLAQIVTPASPTYLYDLVLLGNAADAMASALPARSYMGVLHLASGYTLVEVSIEERSARVSERLTAEAVAASLAASPPASPLLVLPSPNEYLSAGRQSTVRLAPYLPAAFKSDHGSKLSVKVIPPSLVPTIPEGGCDIETARKIVVDNLLQLAEVWDGETDDTSSTSSMARQRTAIDDFKLIGSLKKRSAEQASPTAKTFTHPLHLETATQLGLHNDKSIPPLMSYVLPESAPAAVHRFLRRYLLTPPPPEVCEAMATLVSCLKIEAVSLPPGTVPPLGKVLSLLRAGQASAVVFGEIVQALASTIMFLEIDSAACDKSKHLIEPLMVMLEHESGMSAEPISLKRRCLAAVDAIERVISPLHHASMSTRGRGGAEDPISDFGDVIPSGFLERNEAMWRGRVQQSVANDAYGKVHAAANSLAKAVAEDFFGASIEELTDGTLSINESRTIKNPIVQDVFNNLFAIKQIPIWVKSEDKEKYFHPRDRFGKVLKNRYTTEAVRSAISAYVSACEEACQSVSAALSKLSSDLHDDGHIPAIVQASHANLILYSAHEHARQANALGWNCAEVYEADDQSNEYHESAGFFENVWPYWMQSSIAVQNTYPMKDLFLLTAPNMSGKSTLMRASAAAALLSVCGLCAPLNPGSKVRRFDHIFVRGASADVPAEHKSAFGAEMLDIASLLRCCGPKSLVFVDELGRGTSPRDGTRLAGAVLEAMAKAGMSGFFATHLHDILHLPLEGSERIVKKRMAIQEDESAQLSYKWTYQLTGGVCTDSMALVTAAKFGLPKEVLARAEALSPFVPPAGGAVASTGDDPSEFEGISDVNGGQDPNEVVNGQTSESTDEASYGMDSVAQLVESVAGCEPISVPPYWMAPSSLEGQSCVYILQWMDGCGNPHYYIGETDSMQQRLRQHRAKGGSWSDVDCFAFPVPSGKSEARSMESILIQEMAKSGYRLKSTYDGRTLRPSRQNH